MSIKISIEKNLFFATRNILGAITGPEALVANELQEAIDKVGKDKGFTKVDDIVDLEIEVSQAQLASLKQGFVALVTKDVKAGDVAALLDVAKLFKISKTVEAGIRAKLPQELSENDLDDLVELDN